MEILVAVAVLLVFDVAAWFWGVDSRVVMDDERSIQRAPRRSI
jgi:hypothetical protein